MKRLTKKSVVVTSFQSNFTEDWGSSNEKNHFSNMITSEQWNYGDGQRGVLSSTKNGIISYENLATSSFDYAFAHHPQARILCNDPLTKTIDFLREVATVVEDFYHRLCLK